MKINKLYILGDSFSANGSDCKKNPSGKPAFWVDFLKEDYDVYEYAEGSRDLQTILDSWIKVLPNVNKNDCIVVGLPYFSRWRIPRDESEYKIENEQIVRHIGHHGPMEIKAETVNRDGLEERLFENQIMNSSRASSLNYKEVIESLTKLSKCKVILWSWTRFKQGFKPKGLYDKTDLEKEMGYWGTQHEMYKKSNGKLGTFEDLHWDEQTQHLFLKFVKNKIEE